MSDRVIGAITAIEGQQPKERTAVWMVGEQLKDMVRREPWLAELVAQDLERKELALAECEKQIKAYADKHMTENFACVIPSEAERIIREFYGLPAAGEREEVPEERQAAPEGGLLSLEDFL